MNELEFMLPANQLECARRFLDKAKQEIDEWLTGCPGEELPWHLTEQMRAARSRVFEEETKRLPKHKVFTKKA